MIKFKFSLLWMTSHDIINITKGYSVLTLIFCQLNDLRNLFNTKVIINKMKTFLHLRGISETPYVLKTNLYIY